MEASEDKRSKADTAKLLPAKVQVHMTHQTMAVQRINEAAKQKVSARMTHSPEAPCC